MPSRSVDGAAPGTAQPDALTDGYTTGLLIAGAFYVVALVVAALTITGRVPNTDTAPVEEPAVR